MNGLCKHDAALEWGEGLWCQDCGAIYVKTEAVDIPVDKWVLPRALPFEATQQMVYPAPVNRFMVQPAVKYLLGFFYLNLRDPRRCIHNKTVRISSSCDDCNALSYGNGGA